MNIPSLQPVKRSREFDLYSNDLRSRVIKGWLFDDLTHRQLDQEVLGLDAEASLGYQSMGILHHLGLKKEFRGIFSGVREQDAISILESNEQDFETIIGFLHLSLSSSPTRLSTLIEIEEDELKKSRQDTVQNRRNRIASSPKHPQRMRVYSYTYKRNPDIVAEALFRANGICERCKNPAPFTRASDGTPFLEVHHKRSLSAEGEDTLENVLALCPNCHRELHHGIS